MDLDEAQKGTPAKPPAESLDSHLAATLRLPESSPEPEVTPGGKQKLRLIDQLRSGAGRNATSQQPSSPPLKATGTPWTRRSTRRSAPVGRLDERSPSLPRWSLNNTEWEKDWDSDLVYPSTGRDRATVHKDDLQRLDEGAFLNDNLIFCYLRYLQVETERARPEISKRIYFMNTYFFEILGKSKGPSINYEGVKSWTSKVDIFSFDYIVVPVNEDAHWYLAIICNPRALIEQDDDSDDDAVFFDARQEPGPIDLVSPRKTKIGEDDKRGAVLSPDGDRAHRNGYSGPGRTSGSKDIRIITLDSLGGSHSKTCQVLRKYLVEEAKFRKNLDSVGYTTKIGLTAKNIPSQENFCDCGVFLLGYAQRFLEEPDGFVATILQRGRPEWTVNPSQLRGEIRDTILRLHKQHREERPTRKKKKRKRAQQDEQETPATGPPGSPSPAPQDQEASAPTQDDASNNAQPSGDATTPLTTPASGQTTREISVELDTARTPAEVRMSPRPDLRETSPREGGEMGSPSQRGDAQDLHGAGASDTAVPAKEEDEAAGVKPSVEHDDDEPSSSNVTTLSPDPSCVRAQPEQADEIIHSPSAHSPSNAERCETPQLPPAAPRYPIKVSIEVPGDEPEFIKTIPATPMSRRSAADAVLDGKTSSKRSVRFGRGESNDGSPRASKRLKETGTKSHFFPVDESRTQAVFVPHRRGGPGRGKRKETVSGYAKRQGQENSDTIDLTDQD
ncbi:uncharacterized protein DNG_03515 [Cephalotrichum gorgonifer]|uniref:Ubiquitin-like protease family profile domain-containing protein n=1 Tax=Cephalotrichum gorgonifer TaxID=2041049 RepID=A0AAE8MWD8_9PEZI|nr:uncharacterized protein DNG_03515 [Cephalotrichum gorgonifer]